MQISLNQQSQRFVDEQVRSGRFGSPEEVLQEAIDRMMSDEGSEFDDQTIEAINRAEEQIDRGEGIPFEDFAAMSPEGSMITFRPIPPVYRILLV